MSFLFESAPPSLIGKEQIFVINAIRAYAIAVKRRVLEWQQMFRGHRLKVG